MEYIFKCYNSCCIWDLSIKYVLYNCYTCIYLYIIIYYNIILIKYAVLKINAWFDGGRSTGRQILPQPNFQIGISAYRSTFFQIIRMHTMVILYGNCNHIFHRLYVENGQVVFESICRRRTTNISFYNMLDTHTHI